MQRFCSIFSQLLQLFPRWDFEQAVRAHQAERHTRGFPCWGQFVAMLFCQLGQARSLREICGGLAATEGRLKHLGLDGAPKRSTLAYANQHRPWQLYQSVFELLLGRCQSLVASQGGSKRFRFRNRLLSLDASVIDLCLSLYDWARFRRAKGAVKLHLLLDHDGYLPQFAVLTDGKTHDLTVARKLAFEPGAVVVFDRAYTDYEWFAELGRRGVFFVTRMKRNANYEVLESRPTPERGGILADEVICFPGRAADVGISLIQVTPRCSMRGYGGLSTGLGGARSAVRHRGGLPGVSVSVARTDSGVPTAAMGRLRP